MPPHATGQIDAETTVDGTILTLRIDAPESRNALTPAMAETLADQLEASRERAGAVILCGVGGTFCAGMNATVVREALQSGWDGPFERLVHTTHRLLTTILHSPVPIIVSLEGHAAGLGVTLACLADTRLTTAAARLRPGHLVAGAPLDGGASYALSWLLGPARSMALLLENRAITGADLQQWGLANACVDHAELEAASLTLAQRAAALDPQAVASARRLLRSSSGADFELQWEREAQELHEAVVSGRLRANLERLWSPA